MAEYNNSQWQLRTGDGGMGDTENTNSGSGGDAGSVLSGIGDVLAGSAPLVTAIADAANGDGSSTATQPTQTTSQPSPNKKTSPALVIGGIATVLLIIGLIIYMSNGKSNKSKS